MTKKIKHPYMFDMQYTVSEHVDFPEIEDVLIRITEFTDKQEEALEEVNERKDYLEVHFIRIVMGDESFTTPEDIADSHSGDLLSAIMPIRREDNEEFMDAALKSDTINFISSYIYMNKVNIVGDFDNLSIPGALVKALKTITKGLEADSWCATSYVDRTIKREGKPIDKKEAAKLFKDMGFFSLPEEVSNLDKKQNTLAIVGGSTLIKELDFDSKMLNKKNNKAKM